MSIVLDCYKCFACGTVIDAHEREQLVTLDIQCPGKVVWTVYFDGLKTTTKQCKWTIADYQPVYKKENEQ